MNFEVSLLYITYFIAIASLAVMFHYALKPSKEGDEDIDCLKMKICIFIIVCALTFSVYYYPTHTVAYQNGYNDYSDKDLYNNITTLAPGESEFSELYWYCEGWEQAQKDLLKASVYESSSEKRGS